MCYCRFLFLFSIFLSPSLLAESEDHISIEFDYDPLFPTLITPSWTHSFSETLALNTGFFLDPGDSTVVAFSSVSFNVGEAYVAPGIAVTFGNASWHSGPNKDKIYLAREVGPSLEAGYTSTLIEAATVNFFLPPIQEDRSTAVWLGISRFRLAAKWHELGIGPWFEVYYAKNGSQPWMAAEVRIGGHILANVAKSHFQLYLGYNTVSVANFLGVPSNADFVFRATFIQDF